MTGVPPKLRREWAEKLKATGFEDLEAPGDPDGPLSDRGNLHPVTRQPEEWRRLGDRISDGEEYQAWARNLLHSARWKSAQERRIWELHCDGLGDRDIAAALNCKRWRVQTVISATKAKAAKRWENQRRREQWRPSWQAKAREKAARAASRHLSTEELRRILDRSKAPSSTE